MVKRITLTLPDWLLRIVDKEKEKKNRSEFVTECIVKGLGFDKQILDPKYIEQLTHELIKKKCKT